MSRIKRDDITHFIDEDIYLPTRTLYMGSTGDHEGQEFGVNYSMAERMIKGLHILDSSATEQPITIIMNNLGGDHTHGMAIFDSIKICRNHVTVRVFGHAMSMGAIILQAADDRLMSCNSTMMLHYGSTYLNDHVKNVERWVEWDKKMASNVEHLFLAKIKEAKPRFTLEQVKKLLEFDRILSAKEALDLGLVDGIILETGEVERRIVTQES